MEYPVNWKNENNKLIREFGFSNFVESVNFINLITPFAENMNHHPDIEIYSYKFVKIKLRTHSEGNIITSKDIKLAMKINEIYENS